MASDMDFMCAAYGSIISVVVSILKRIPFVKNHPKYVSLALSCVMPLITHFAALSGTGNAKAVAAQIVACVLAQFATAVTFHETVTNSVTG